MDNFIMMSLKIDKEQIKKVQNMMEYVQVYYQILQQNANI
jgi:hypothetical protein